MAPLFESLALRYPSALCLKIDCDRLRPVADVFKINTYPTFLFFMNSTLLAEVVGDSSVERQALEKHFQSFLGQKPTEPVHVQNDVEFENLIDSAEGGLVVVDFFTTWCGPCKRVAPLFHQLAVERPDVLFLKVDGDLCRQTTMKWSIAAFPTFLFFKDGLNCGTVRGGQMDLIKQKINELSAMPPGAIMEYYQSSGGQQQ